MSLALVLFIFQMNSWKQREAGWFVKAEEAEIMPRLELNVWFFILKSYCSLQNTCPVLISGSGNSAWEIKK